MLGWLIDTPVRTTKRTVCITFSSRTAELRGDCTPVSYISCIVLMLDFFLLFVMIIVLFYRQLVELNGVLSFRTAYGFFLAALISEKRQWRSAKFLWTFAAYKVALKLSMRYLYSAFLWPKQSRSATEWHMLTGSHSFYLPPTRPSLRYSMSIHQMAPPERGRTHPM